MQLALLLDAWMKANKVSDRKLAAQLGLEHSTLFRFRKGETLNNVNLSRILIWLLSPSSKP